MLTVSALSQKDYRSRSANTENTDIFYPRKLNNSAVCCSGGGIFNVNKFMNV